MLEIMEQWKDRFHILYLLKFSYLLLNQKKTCFNNFLSILFYRQRFHLWRHFIFHHSFKISQQETFLPSLVYGDFGSFHNRSHRSNFRIKYIFREQILASVEWGNNDAVTAIWMNRVQNQAFIVSYDTSKNPTAVITVSVFSEYELDIDVYFSFCKKTVIIRHQYYW